MGQNALSDFVPLFSIGGKGLCSRGTDYSQSKGKYVSLFQVTVVLWVRTAKLVHDISQKIVTCCQEFLRIIKKKKRQVFTSWRTSFARNLLSPSSTCGLVTVVTWPRSPDTEEIVKILSTLLSHVCIKQSSGHVISSSYLFCTPHLWWDHLLHLQIPLHLEQVCVKWIYCLKKKKKSQN